jgi:hypothetical protein
MTADFPHVVREDDERDHDALVGNYECPGNPCVHLCTLRVWISGANLHIE